MAEKRFRPGDNLIVIRHPKKGDARNVKEMRRKLVHALDRCRGNVCFYHDASDMKEASRDYAKLFSEMDWLMSRESAAHVCLIPGKEPRYMARMISMLSDKHWRIYKDKPKAVLFLSFLGWPLMPATPAEEVSAYVMGKDHKLHDIYPHMHIE